VLDCLDSGWISSIGEYVDRFESLFARFCGADHAIATANGTVALHLALAALDLGPGDEVLVPGLTFVATANAVTYTGATPVLVDVDRVTWTIDPEDAARKITARTRAIIPVHLYGHPANLDALRALATRHDLRVVEDAAQAHGARYNGARVGALGDVGTFSFYGNKVLTTGEGGMVVTNDQAIARRARLLRGQALDPDRRYYHAEVGFNYRLTNLQAAIGCAQLEHADAILRRRAELAAAYDARLADVPGLGFQPVAPWATPICWMYSVVIDETTFGMTRDEVADALRARGIETRPFFVPLHDLPPYRTTPLPVSAALGRSGINLPSGNTLAATDIDLVCAALADLARSR
jgi:perosamine synthetase